MKLKKRFKIINLIILCLSVFITRSAFAQTLKPNGAINDYANILTAEEIKTLADIAKSLKQENGTEIAILTIESIEPWSPKELATKTFNDWGIGNKEDHNGILILLVIDDKRVEVEIGYGLEGILPDGLVGSVLDSEGMPYFKKGEYGTGLIGITKTYADIARGEEFTSSNSNDYVTLMFSILCVVIAIIIVSIVIIVIDNENSGYDGSSRSGGISGGSRSRGGGFGGGFGGGRSGGGGVGRSF